MSLYKSKLLSMSHRVNLTSQRTGLSRTIDIQHCNNKTFLRGISRLWKNVWRYSELYCKVTPLKSVRSRGSRMAMEILANWLWGSDRFKNFVEQGQTLTSRSIICMSLKYDLLIKFNIRKLRILQSTLGFENLVITRGILKTFLKISVALFGLPVFETSLC